MHLHRNYREHHHGYNNMFSLLIFLLLVSNKSVFSIVYVKETVPLITEHDITASRSTHVESRIQCALSCHITTDCVTFVHEDLECNRAPTPREYTGTRATVVAGATCQAWDTHTPHYNHYLNSSPLNYCRDPDDDGHTWCYTMDPDLRWDACDVPQCDFHFKDDFCIQGGLTNTYVGKVSETMSGIPCQRWDEQTPHSHTLTDGHFPDGSLSAAENYCRDPNADGYLWCYTTDPGVRAMPCDVPNCQDVIPMKRCHADGLPLFNYTGKWSRTVADLPCQYWNVTTPHNHNYNDDEFIDATIHDAANYCRDPDDDGFLWCYTTTSVRYQPCGIGPCKRHVPCKHSLPTYLYTGTWNTTVSGRTCQHWDSQVPHSHSFAVTHFLTLNGDLSSVGNGCRDPDGRGYLWCFTTDPSIVSESCGISVCKENEHDNCHLYNTILPTGNRDDLSPIYAFKGV